MYKITTNMQHIKNIMKKRMQTASGWTKLDTDKRYIRIGSSSNCNDEIVYDPRSKEFIACLLDQYGIVYEITSIENTQERSVELRLTEEQYSILYSKLE